MRFTSILLAALPLIGSAFAAPIVKGEVARAPVAVASRDIDVLSIVAELEASVKAAGSLTSASAEVDVSACLNVVIDAFDTCGSALGIDLTLGVDATVSLDKRDFKFASRDEKDQVAQYLASVVKFVNEDIIAPVASDILAQDAIKTLLSQVDTSLQAILCGVESILAGVLTLVTSLLGDVTYLVSGLLSGVLSIL